MFFIIVTQLLELQIPNMLVRHARGMEIEFNFVEPLFSFQVHFASFEDGTLFTDPSAL
jgi:hypothetical protein